MMRFHLSHVVDKLVQSTTLEQLAERLDAAATELGFERFAMGHHVNLLGPPMDALRLTNYPTGWIERALEKRYFANDPIHRASIHKATGFLWSEVVDLITLSDQDRHVLGAARDFGLIEGYTVPVHVPGEYRGTCSFAARSFSRLRDDALPLATMIGAYAFEGGRAIIAKGSTANYAGAVPILTDRQRDALVLIARGKGDVEIGMLLGISRATAHEHVENVRRAYGNPQRAFLVARALFDGQISFGEVFRR